MSTESTGYEQGDLVDPEYCSATMLKVHSYNWRRLRMDNMELRCICGQPPPDPEATTEQLRESGREQRRQKIAAINLRTQPDKAPEQGKLPL